MKDSRGVLRAGLGDDRIGKVEGNGKTTNNGTG